MFALSRCKYKFILEKKLLDFEKNMLKPSNNIYIYNINVILKTITVHKNITVKL